MEFPEIKSLIEERLGVESVLRVDEGGDRPVLVLAPERIAEACGLLRDEERTFFDLLSCLSAVDEGPEEGLLSAVYQLYSIPYDLHLTIKCEVPREGGSLPTLTGLYGAANWHEREAYDLTGLRFEGHPDLRRILLPADWEGHPLRKDYAHQERYHGVKVAY